MKALTKKQRKLLEFLTSYAKIFGYPPTVREIGEHFGFLWTAARGLLQALDRKGFVKINPSKSRGIEIMGLNPAEGIKVPVVGKIRAGRPILAKEDMDAHILIDKKKIILKPENRNMKPESYDPDGVTVIGKVIGVIRKV